MRDCDDALTAAASPQTLTSIGYPNGYPHSTDCVWTIDTVDNDPDHSVVSIQVCNRDPKTHSDKKLNSHTDK